MFFATFRKIVTGGHLAKAAVALATFVAVWVAIATLPSTNAFWAVANGRLSQDEAFQLQRLFLPDRKARISLLIIGDSMFVSELPSEITDGPDVRELVINGYDADDLGGITRTMRAGERNTETEVCALLVQISPLFNLRAKALGQRQQYAILRDVHKQADPVAKAKQFFGFIDAWAQSQRTMPALDNDALRPERMVGQARFADPSKENWLYAFRDLEKLNRPVIGVLDTRGTDWGEGGDLISETEKGLTDLADTYDHFQWVPLSGVRDLEVKGCAS